MAAKNKFLNAMKMPSIDDMFSSEADRQRGKRRFGHRGAAFPSCHPFVGHPFEVCDDEDMQKLVDSIRENGVLTNLTVRRRAEGGYEIISGHRRFHAAQRAGLDRVKVRCGILMMTRRLLTWSIPIFSGSISVRWRRPGRMR